MVDLMAQVHTTNPTRQAVPTKKSFPALAPSRVCEMVRKMVHEMVQETVQLMRLGMAQASARETMLLTRPLRQHRVRTRTMTPMSHVIWTSGNFL
jgi:hypothetical protein